MSCPVWRADCQAKAVIDAGRGAWRAANTTYDVATTAASGGGKVIGALGVIFPLLLLVGIVILFGKLLSAGRSVAVGVADGATGGQVSRVRDSLAEANPVVRRRTSKGTTKRSSNRGGAGRSLGADLGQRTRQRREVARGPQPTFHSGKGTEVIRRQDDQLGRPRVVEVCAADPGAAATVLGVRMQGHQWRAGAAKRCDLNKAHRHFTFQRAVR